MRRRISSAPTSRLRPRTIVLPPRRPDDPAFRERLRALARLFGDRCYLAGTTLFRGDAARRLAQLDNLAAEMGVGLVATNDVHYHAPERRALQDVVTAIRVGCTVDALWCAGASARRPCRIRVCVR